MYLKMEGCAAIVEIVHMGGHLMFGQQNNPIGGWFEIAFDPIRGCSKVQRHLMVRAAHTRIADSAPVPPDGAVDVAKEQVADSGFVAISARLSFDPGRKGPITGSL